MRGLVGYADFCWADARVIGEFDGRVKYLDESYLRGRSASDAVIAEKIREGRLRALGFRVTRWTWSDLHSPERLAAQLEAARVVRRRRFSSTRDDI